MNYTKPTQDIKEEKKRQLKRIHYTYIHLAICSMMYFVPAIVSGVLIINNGLLAFWSGLGWMPIIILFGYMEDVIDKQFRTKD